MEQNGSIPQRSMFYENSNSSPDGFEGLRAALRSADTRLTQSVSSY